ncbi:hypothetical protein, partial [Alistipes sp.]|uniref:hypothetical protein n=1 Tax=Alistipes sp. TaxID=1872444 RepID=UPI003A8A998F
EKMQASLLLLSAYSYLWLRLRYCASEKMQASLLLLSAYSYLWLRLRYCASEKMQASLLFSLGLFVSLTSENN